jgi:carbon monoxide dehydrogenase subunit G
MLKIVIIAAAVTALTIGAVLAYAATLPDRFQVQRSLGINAPAERIFPLINDLRVFNTWNPFDKKEANNNGTYGGPTSGIGAIYGFDGKKTGTGRIEIIDSAPPSKVVMRLLITKPIAADNRITFTLAPENNTTRVTWAMDGGVPLVGKLVHLVCNMDKMVGHDFESGLADLKVLAET